MGEMLAQVPQTGAKREYPGFAGKYREMASGRGVTK
jgi:hypothetical protein